MSLETVKYRDWFFEVDRSKTESLYAEIKLASSEECGCGNCKYFRSIIDSIYPEEIKMLFKKLGIDINKDFETTDFGGEEDGHIYDGYFYFSGRIIQGKDCYVPLPQGGHTSDLLYIDDVFEVGFTDKISISFFENKKDLVQVQFMTKVAWELR
ncbi:MAG TPA: hypothetical protein VHS53_19435 [Mucilaginibacter sp.]|nr:hypothetical protein [Mucilaginibacter sp.]